MGKDHSSRGKFFDGDKAIVNNPVGEGDGEWMCVWQDVVGELLSPTGELGNLNEKMKFDRNSNISFIPWEH